MGWVKDVNRSLGSPRVFAAIRSSPVSMVGDSSLCIEGRILPLNGAHFSHEQFNFRWPLPRVAGSPDRRVVSASLTAVRSSLPYGLVGPYKLHLNLTALPCSHEVLWSHAGGTNPGSISGHSLCRIQRFRLPHRGIGSATSITIDFGAIFSFTAVLACKPPGLRFAVPC